jgi:hypothetical protein
MANDYFFDPFGGEEEEEEYLQPSLPSRGAWLPTLRIRHGLVAPEALRGMVPEQERPAVGPQEFPPALFGLMPQGDLDEGIPLAGLPLEMDLPAVGLPELSTVTASMRRMQYTGIPVRWKRTSFHPDHPGRGWVNPLTNAFISDLVVFGHTEDGRRVFLSPHGELVVEDQEDLIPFYGVCYPGPPRG